MNSQIKELNENLAVLSKTLREEKGMSEQELAKKIHINLNYLKKIENKDILINPRMTTLKKLSEGLEIPFDSLLKKIIK